MKVKSNNKLLLNMSSYAVLQIVNLLVGMVLPRFFLATYGSEINGIISTISSFTSYFSYLEAGLGLALIHSLFKPLAEENHNQINGILSYCKKQYGKISFTYLGLVVSLSFIFPLINKTASIGAFEFGCLVFVIGAYGALDFFTMAKYRVLLTADRKEYIISNAMILAQLARFVFVWLLLKLNISVVFVKAMPIFTLLIRSLILRWYVKRKYSHIDFSSSVLEEVELAKNRWDALLLQITINTSTALPAIIISQILDFKEANIYAIYSLVVTAIISIVSALSSGVSPMLGKNLAQGKNIVKTYEIYQYVVNVAITVLFSIASIMMIPFIELYTSGIADINYIYPIYAPLICIWAALHSYRIPLTAIINAGAIYRENRINNIVNLLLQLIAGVLGVVIKGITGLLCAMIVSAIHRNVCFYVNNSKKLLHNKISKCLSQQSIIVLVILISYLVGYNILKNIRFGWAYWIFMACIVTFAEIVIGVVVFSIANYSVVREIIAFLKSRKNGGEVA